MRAVREGLIADGVAVRVGAVVVAKFDRLNRNLFDFLATQREMQVEDVHFASVDETVDTRGPFKGPRVYDGSGLPLHYDNQSIFKERIYLDRSDPNLLHDEITVIDHALTRPWTVDKRYRRSVRTVPVWPEYVCAENNAQVRLGDEYYYLSADRLLMPTRKDQLPPDLRYFNQSRR